MAPPEAAVATLRTLAEAVAASAPTEAAAVADFRRLSGLLSGWSRRGDTAAVAVDNLQSRLQPALKAASEVAANPAAAAPLRLVAIDLLGSASATGLDQSVPLIALLTPRSPVAVQMAAVTAMAQSRRAELASELLDDWSARSPEIRRAITSLLLQRGEWTERLMTAVESENVPAAELDINQRRQLLEHPRKAVREAAARCLNTGTTPNRQEIINRYAEVFDESTRSSGTATAGPELIASGLAAFRKHCANCHRLQEAGYAIGPDIANYAAKSPLALITAVLDPNQAVDPRYQSAGVVLQDGRTLTGLITAETDNSLTLLAPEGRSTQLLRSEIDQLRSTGKSLMPEKFEQTVSAADLHLIWLWIRAQRQPPNSWMAIRHNSLNCPRPETSFSMPPPQKFAAEILRLNCHFRMWATGTVPKTMSAGHCVRQSPAMWMSGLNGPAIRIPQATVLSLKFPDAASPAPWILLVVGIVISCSTLAR
jgi:putative heme-binding domain-containing protein